MVNQQRVVKQSSAWLARKGKNAMNLKPIQKVKISTSGQKKANKFLNGTAKSMLPYSFDLSSRKHTHTHIHLGRLAVTVGCTFAQLPHWHVANRLECQPDWSPVLTAHCCRPHGTENVDHEGGFGCPTNSRTQGATYRLVDFIEFRLSITCQKGSCPASATTTAAAVATTTTTRRRHTTTTNVLNPSCPVRGRCNAPQRWCASSLNSHSDCVQFLGDSGVAGGRLLFQFHWRYHKSNNQQCQSAGRRRDARSWQCYCVLACVAFTAPVAVWLCRAMCGPVWAGTENGCAAQKCTCKLQLAKWGKSVGKLNFHLLAT